MDSEKIFIFGDSHARYFDVNDKVISHAPWVRGVNIDLHKYPASTIIGLGRRNSTLNLSDKIKSILSDDRSSARCFCFGQVDIELGFYFRKIVKNEDITFDDFIPHLLDNYKSFLDNHNNGKLILKGINLTVLKNEQFAINYVSRIITENIDDEKLRREYIIKLKSSFDSFKLRNKAMIDFNRGLKVLSKSSGWKYFDINDEISNFTPGKGVIDSYIPSGNDHHLVDSIHTRLPEHKKGPLIAAPYIARNIWE